jgi:hypothetical protein
MAWASVVLFPPHSAGFFSALLQFLLYRSQRSELRYDLMREVFSPFRQLCFAISRGPSPILIETHTVGYVVGMLAVEEWSCQAESWLTFLC